MAINLNADKYGAQFAAFVNFASKQTNPNYIARIEKPKPEADLIGLDGMPRTITAKSWDGCGQVLRLSGSRKVNNEVRDLFLRTILSVCCANTIEELPQSVQDVLKAGDFNGKGHPLTARRIKAVTDAVMVAAGLTTAGGAIAFGTSPTVEKIQHMAMTAPCVPPDAEPDKKVAAFSTKLSENTAKKLAVDVTNLVCKQLNPDGKIDVTKGHAQFKKDLERDMTIYIEGRKIRAGGINGNATDEVPKDYETARDELVRFITGDIEDTFEAASDSVKRQVYLLMSLLNQYSSAAVMQAFMQTVEKPDASCAIMEGKDVCKAGTPMNFTLSKTTDGNINISFEQDIGIQIVLLNGTPCFVDYDTSCCHIGAEINVSADSLEKVANGDWTKLDSKGFDAADNIDGQIDSIPAQLRLDSKVSASVHFEVYDVKPHQDPNSGKYVPPQVAQGPVGNA